MDAKKIDPALGLLKEFSKITGSTSQHIHSMRQSSIFKNGTVAAKYKILGAMLWSISARCEPCIKYYVQQAKENQVSEQEIGEFLALASTMGGCVGEMWALKAYQAFRDQDIERSEGDGISCCR